MKMKFKKHNLNTRKFSAMEKLKKKKKKETAMVGDGN